MSPLDPAGSRPTGYRPPSADGHAVRWSTWDGDFEEHTDLRWENEGWTVTGQVERERVQYVLRLSPMWQVRQFLLFRDLDEPDLWLATDGAGHWGEMNGAHRTELDGCYDLDLACTPFTNTLPIRRLPLHVGHTADIRVVFVDPETLEVRADVQRYTRVGPQLWRFRQESSGAETDLEVDEYGLVIDSPGMFRRLDG